VEIESQLAKETMGTSHKQLPAHASTCCHDHRRRARSHSSVVGSPKQAELISGRLTLEHAPAGQELCVTAVRGENGHAQRLRELGMFEGQTVRVLSPGNPLICQVGDCRFGMCKRLAHCILVEPVAN
jgi:Fe2+ transport system protein FeoA